MLVDVYQMNGDKLTKLCDSQLKTVIPDQILRKQFLKELSKFHDKPLYINKQNNVNNININININIGDNKSNDIDNNCNDNSDSDDDTDSNESESEEYVYTKKRKNKNKKIKKKKIEKIPFWNKKMMSKWSKNELELWLQSLPIKFKYLKNILINTWNMNGNKLLKKTSNKKFFEKIIIDDDIRDDFLNRIEKFKEKECKNVIEFITNKLQNKYNNYINALKQVINDIYGENYDIEDDDEQEIINDLLYKNSQTIEEISNICEGTSNTKSIELFRKDIKKTIQSYQSLFSDNTTNSDDIKICIKTINNEIFNIIMDKNDKIGDIKWDLNNEYMIGDINNQILIYQGRILNNFESISSLIKNNINQLKFILVIKNINIDDKQFNKMLDNIISQYSKNNKNIQCNNDNLFKVNIQLSKTQCITVNADAQTQIFAIKCMIVENGHGKSVNNIELKYNGSPLNDEKTLSDIGINDSRNLLVAAFKVQDSTYVIPQQQIML